MKTIIKSKRQQQLDAELGIIIDEMGHAMWNANKDWIAKSNSEFAFTLNMQRALNKFKLYCEEHYGHK